MQLNAPLMLTYDEDLVDAILAGNQPVPLAAPQRNREHYRCWSFPMTNLYLLGSRMATLLGGRGYKVTELFNAGWNISEKFGISDYIEGFQLTYDPHRSGRAEFRLVFNVIDINATIPHRARHQQTIPIYHRLSHDLVAAMLADCLTTAYFMRPGFAHLEYFKDIPAKVYEKTRSETPLAIRSSTAESMSKEIHKLIKTAAEDTLEFTIKFHMTTVSLRDERQRHSTRIWEFDNNAQCSQA